MTWTRKVTASQSTRSSTAEDINGPKILQKPRLFSLPTRQRALGKDSVKAGEIFWPADLLPSDCPGARILTWGYESHVSKFFGGPVNKNHMSMHAKDLLYELSRERSECVRPIIRLLKLVAKQASLLQPGRPLIFVAHSLGGKWDFKIGCNLIISAS